MKTFALFSIFGAAMGHLIMNSPVPFGVDTLNNSPLMDIKPGAVGSDFPCKQRPGVYDITAMNNMKVGDTQLLNFTGSASHGGGTCQIAVSMDLEPDISSTWKVIQVYEGGCPISADGNDGTHPFTFEIPSGFPNGRATLSWTWYNRIGNREIYQNCAPITVTGGSDSKDLYNSLPNLYVINLPTSECSTVETTDQIIPNPGQYILSNTADSNTLATATGPSCAASAAAQTSGVSGYQTAVVLDGAAYSAPATNMDVTGSAPAATGSATAIGVSGAASATASTTSVPSVATPATTATTAASTGMIIITPVSSPAATATAAGDSSSSDVYPYPTSGSSDSAATTPAQTTSTAAADSSTAAPAATSASVSSPGTGPGSGTSSGSSPSSGGSTCSQQGAIVCNGASQFGLCNFGSVVWQDVAPGTTCSNGQIMRKRRVDMRQASIRREALRTEFDIERKRSALEVDEDAEESEGLDS